MGRFARRKKRTEAPEPGVAAAVAAEDLQEVSRTCGICAAAFTVTVPATRGDLSGPLACPVCRTACPG